jgi:hypothetical protein
MVSRGQAIGLSNNKNSRRDKVPSKLPAYPCHVGLLFPYVLFRTRLAFCSNRVAGEAADTRNLGREIGGSNPDRKS